MRTFKENIISILIKYCPTVESTDLGGYIYTHICTHTYIYIYIYIYIPIYIENLYIYIYTSYSTCQMYIMEIDVYSKGGVCVCLWVFCSNINSRE